MPTDVNLSKVSQLMGGEPQARLSSLQGSRSGLPTPLPPLQL